MGGTKGERTRELLIEQAAALFNQRGYEATSLSEVMDATGLTKGGIYRHFENKEELSLAAFHYAIAQMRRRFAQALLGVGSPRARITTMISVYARIPSDPPVPGGCPLLNAAIEADDSNPTLCRAARAVMVELEHALEAMVRTGKKRGEFSAFVDPVEVAQMIIAQLEGAVMLSKLYGNDAPMRRAQSHLESWLSQLGPPLRAPRATPKNAGESRVPLGARKRRTTPPRR